MQKFGLKFSSERNEKSLLNLEKEYTQGEIYRSRTCKYN